MPDDPKRSDKPKKPSSSAKPLEFPRLTPRDGLPAVRQPTPGSLLSSKPAKTQSAASDSTAAPSTKDALASLRERLMAPLGGASKSAEPAADEAPDSPPDAPAAPTSASAAKPPAVPSKAAPSATAAPTAEAEPRAPSADAPPKAEAKASTAAEGQAEAKLVAEPPPEPSSGPRSAGSADDDPAERDEDETAPIAEARDPEPSSRRTVEPSDRRPPTLSSPRRAVADSAAWSAEMRAVRGLRRRQVVVRVVVAVLAIGVVAAGVGYFVSLTHQDEETLTDLTPEQRLQSHFATRLGDAPLTRFAVAPAGDVGASDVLLARVSDTERPQVPALECAVLDTSVLCRGEGDLGTAVVRHLDLAAHPDRLDEAQWLTLSTWLLGVDPDAVYTQPAAPAATPLTTVLAIGPAPPSALGQQAFARLVHAALEPLASGDPLAVVALVDGQLRPVLLVPDAGDWPEAESRLADVVWPPDFTAPPPPPLQVPDLGATHLLYVLEANAAPPLAPDAILSALQLPAGPDAPAPTVTAVVLGVPPGEEPAVAAFTGEGHLVRLDTTEALASTVRDNVLDATGRPTPIGPPQVARGPAGTVVAFYAPGDAEAGPGTWQRLALHVTPGGAVNALAGPPWRAAVPGDSGSTAPSPALQPDLEEADPDCDDCEEQRETAAEARRPSDEPSAEGHHRDRERHRDRADDLRHTRVERHPAPHPEVVATRDVRSSALTSQDIRTTLRPHLPSLTRCASGYHGGVTLQFTVESGGHVSATSADGPALPRRVEDCLGRTLSDVRFSGYVGPDVLASYIVVF